MTWRPKPGQEVGFRRGTYRNWKWILGTVKSVSEDEIVRVKIYDGEDCFDAGGYVRVPVSQVRSLPRMPKSGGSYIT